MLLDETKLYVVRNNDLIIQGNRNDTDSLLDIRIHNTLPLSAQFQMPTLYGGLYPTPPASSSHLLPLVLHLSSNASIQSIYKIFADFDSLIDLHSCDQAIEQ